MSRILFTVLCAALLPLSAIAAQQTDSYEEVIAGKFYQALYCKASDPGTPSAANGEGCATGDYSTYIVSSGAIRYSLFARIHSGAMTISLWGCHAMGGNTAPANGTSPVGHQTSAARTAICVPLCVGVDQAGATIAIDGLSTGVQFCSYSTDTFGSFDWVAVYVDASSSGEFEADINLGQAAN